MLEKNSLGFRQNPIIFFLFFNRCETPVNVYFNIKHGLQKPLPNWLSEEVKDLIMYELHIYVVTMNC
jgi:hypothetical protein